LPVRESGRARGWALQGLYAWEARDAIPEEMVRVLADLFSTLHVSTRNRAFAEVLVRLVSVNLPLIDRTIEGSLTNWRMNRLSMVDRNILRLGVAELMFVDEVPARTTVREMVSLAEKFGTHESPRFVGGVLDAVARKLAPEPDDAAAS
jgi:transcription antitermination protein NusB